MPAGAVKFVRADQGYGFIVPEDGGPDIHFRVSDSCVPVYLLRPGTEVSFELATNARGQRSARNVTLPSGPSVSSSSATGRLKFWDGSKGYGFVEVESLAEDIYVSRWTTVFERSQEPATKDLVKVEYFNDPERKNPQGLHLDVLELAPWEPDPNNPLFNFAEMGPRAQWVEELANLAEPENWDYRRTPTGGKPILDSYLRYTYLRLKEEGKISVSEDGSHAAFNTGLVTPMQEEIFAFFDRQPKAGRQDWQLIGFRKRSDRQFLEYFGRRLPELANYFDDPSVLLYDRRLQLHINIDHVLENIDRFPEQLKENAFQARMAVQAAEAITRERVYRNYKTAIPQWYRARSGAAAVQLLIPLCLREPNVADLALVVERDDGFYRGNTVLTLDMAYKNARLLARPDSEWLIP